MIWTPYSLVAAQSGGGARAKMVKSVRKSSRKMGKVRADSVRLKSCHMARCARLTTRRPSGIRLGYIYIYIYTESSDQHCQKLKLTRSLTVTLRIEIEVAELNEP